MMGDSTPAFIDRQYTAVGKGCADLAFMLIEGYTTERCAAARHAAAHLLPSISPALPLPPSTSGAPRSSRSSRQSTLRRSRQRV